MNINLALYKDSDVKFYSGRPRGQIVRKEINLDTLENKTQEITVTVPLDVDSIHASFFLGLFGESVRKCGSKENFLKKFHFICADVVHEDINEGIEQALKRSNVLRQS